VIAAIPPADNGVSWINPKRFVWRAPRLTRFLVGASDLLTGVLKIAIS
jgi:hypothetical protein